VNTGEESAPIRRRGRPQIPFDRIVATAVEILDEAGIDGLSMRSLADRLGSGTATLYRHVAGKDELLALAVDQVLGELVLEAPAEANTWQDAVRLGATGLFAVLSRHRGVGPLLVSHAPVGPNGLRVREQALAVLLDAGFAPKSAGRAYTAIAHYVVGSAIQQSSSGAPEAVDEDQIRLLFRGLDGKRFPATRATARYVPGTSVEAEFVFGLDLLIAGLTQLLKDQRAPNTRSARRGGRGSR
jgi:AcrR family transcriptional regulator